MASIELDNITPFHFGSVSFSVFIGAFRYVFRWQQSTPTRLFSSDYLNFILFLFFFSPWASNDESPRRQGKGFLRFWFAFNVLNATVKTWIGRWLMIFLFYFPFFFSFFFVVDYFSHRPRSARRLPSSLVVVCFVQLDCCPPIKSAAVSQPSSAELTRFLPVFTGFYRVLPSFVRHYRHEPVLCGFLWALRGFPSFYRVFIPFWCVLLGFKRFL